jgi:threonine dehydratase
VVAFSSGNHAQGVAAAAALLDIPAVIVMPADAPPIKLANTRAYGAEIITYDRWTESRERIAADIAEQRGAVLVKPFDDPLIIAGQGTVGLEIVEQAAELGIPVDALVAGASGGGLIAGTAIAVSALSPETRLYCAEPAGFDDHARSLAVGSIVANAPGGGSICDALLSPRPGDVTFPINRQLLSGGLVATDDETCRAMAVAFGAFKLVLEPGGAVALAAALAHRVPGNPTSIVVVASGGNVEPALFARAIMTGS